MTIKFRKKPGQHGTVVEVNGKQVATIHGTHHGNGGWLIRAPEGIYIEKKMNDAPPGFSWGENGGFSFVPANAETLNGDWKKIKDFDFNTFVRLKDAKVAALAIWG